MLDQDLQTLLDRLDRISHALDLGCESLRRRSGGHSDRPDVELALVETCWESVRLGHELVRRLAYDDLWCDLELLLHCWRSIAARAHEARGVALAAGEAMEAAREVVTALRVILDAVAEIDTTQLEATARPRDPAACTRATAAIGHLEGAADRYFMDSLTADEHGRLDAALALLTTIAARAALERAAVGVRRT